MRRTRARVASIQPNSIQLHYIDVHTQSQTQTQTDTHTREYMYVCEELCMYVMSVCGACSYPR